MAEELPNRRGYIVNCPDCGDDEMFHSLWYDVAERYADTHDTTYGHDAYVVAVVEEVWTRDDD